MYGREILSATVIPMTYDYALLLSIHSLNMRISLLGCWPRLWQHDPSRPRTDLIPISSHSFQTQYPRSYVFRSE